MARRPGKRARVGAAARRLVLIGASIAALAIAPSAGASPDAAGIGSHAAAPRVARELLYLDLAAHSCTFDGYLRETAHMMAGPMVSHLHDVFAGTDAARVAREIRSHFIHDLRSDRARTCSKARHEIIERSSHS